MKNQTLIKFNDLVKNCPTKYRSIGSQVIVGFVALMICRHILSPNGYLSFVDYNLPTSERALSNAIASSFSPWNGNLGLGSINSGFFGTSFYLVLFWIITRFLSLAAGSHYLILILVLLDGFGFYFAARKKLTAGFLGSALGAVLWIGNPWFYNSLSQGHIYELIVFALLPWTIFAILRGEPNTWRQVGLHSISAAAIIGSDYHFGGILLFIIFISMFRKAINRNVSGCIKSIACLSVSIGILSMWILPYILNYSNVILSNSTGTSQLSYFSKFVSSRDALLLYQPLLNSGDALVSLGHYLSSAWGFLSLLFVFFLFGGLYLKENREKIGGYLLIILAIVGAFFANGLNYPTNNVLSWLYTRSSLMNIYVNPSRFLFFPALLLAATLSKSINSDLKFRTELLKNNKHFLFKINSPEKWKILFLVFFTFLYISPFVLHSIATAGIETNNIYSKQSNSALQSGRLMYLPSQQYLLRNSSGYPYIDPKENYPVGPTAVLAPSYNLGAGNRFLQWLNLDLYYLQTSNFMNLASLAGINKILVTPNLIPNTGNTTIDNLESNSRLRTALSIQNTHLLSKNISGSKVFSLKGSGSVLGLSSSVIELDGTSYDPLNTLADALPLSDKAICFRGDCHLSPNFRLSLLGNRTSSSKIATYKINSIDNYLSDNKWINGQTAIGEANGEISAQTASTVFGIGSATGKFYIDHIGRGSFLSTQVLVGPSRTHYTMSCGQEIFVNDLPPTLGGFVWQTWIVKFSESFSGDCTIKMKGQQGALTSLTKSYSVSYDASLPELQVISPNYPSMSYGAIADSSNGVPASSVYMKKDSSVIYSAPDKGTVYVIAKTIRGAGTLTFNKITNRYVGPNVELYSFINNSANNIEIDSSSGKVIIERIFVLHNIGFKSVEKRNSCPTFKSTGNLGLENSTSALITTALNTEEMKNCYLVLRGSESAWRVNKLKSSGIFLGYGGIWHLGDKKLNITNVAQNQSSLGLVISFLSLLLSIFMILCGSRKRKSAA